ncbi:MAG: MFS transporter, partial [Desulfatiglandales bacterium]|nr:MFS transporter [Desulfatiglandales bacterium]
MPEPDKISHKSSWVILICVSMIILVVYVLLQAVSPLLPAVIEDFQVSHSAGGFLYAVPIMMIALFTYPLGIASDCLGSAKALGLGGAIILFSSLLRVFSSNFYLMLLFTGMFGLGFSLNLPNLSKTVKEHFPTHLVGKATGVYTAAIPFGSGLGIALTKPLFEATGNWRHTVTILTLIAIPLISLSLIEMNRTKKRAPGTFQPPTEQQLSTGGAMENRKSAPAKDLYVLDIIICGILLSLLNFTFFATIGWLPTYLTEVGWTSVSAGAATSLISFVEVPAILLYPFLSD